jgi:hypothetical protein
MRRIIWASSATGPGAYSALSTAVPVAAAATMSSTARTMPRALMPYSLKAVALTALAITAKSGSGAFRLGDDFAFLRFRKSWEKGRRAGRARAVVGRARGRRVPRGPGGVARTT